jgi:hypothetical protein
MGTKIGTEMVLLFFVMQKAGGGGKRTSGEEDNLKGDESCIKGAVTMWSIL